MAEPTNEQLAWAAGWFEGEGSVPNNKGKPAAASISITNTDLEVLEAFANLFGCGRIYPLPRDEHKPRWIYHVSGEDAVSILERLYPWLHSRRRQRIDELFEARRQRMSPRPCKECGATVTPKFMVGGSPQFCSTLCNGRYWRRQAVPA